MPPEQYKQCFFWIKSSLNENQTQARLIFETTLKISYEQIFLYPQKKVPPSLRKKICEIVQRRQKNEPLQYILGKAHFYDLEFFVGQGVLIPRPETEVLVEKALTLVSKKSKILELCVGSGAVACSLKNCLPSLQITGSDISCHALSYAKKNCSFHNLDIPLIQSDLFNDIKEKNFNLIIANPPYISTKLYQNLPKEISQYEPEIALHSGYDGLDIIKKIVKEAKTYLAKDAYLLLEVCSTHTQKVARLFEQNFYQNIQILEDYSGRERFILGQFY